MNLKILPALLVLSVTFPVLIQAQGSTDVDQTKKETAELKTGSQKGKFHIGLQDFSFGATAGMFTVSSFSIRAGYSFSDKDMLFLSGQYTWNPREGYFKAIETNLFYRHYFMDGAFQPFVQVGAGLGYIEVAATEYQASDNFFYGVGSIGTGVSFRYKRWGFEAGIQTDYNRYSTGRLSIRPIVGISYSF